MKKSDLRAGQFLPLTVMFLPVMILLYFYLFDEGHGSYQHIQQQKKVDTYAYHLANDQARALNAVAALNEALETAHKRAVLMATVIAGLTACSPFNPACARALSRLMPKVKPFYDKLEKLGASLAKQQDEILEWAHLSQLSSLGYFNFQQPGLTFALEPSVQKPLREWLFRGESKASKLHQLVECRYHTTRSPTHASTLVGLSDANQAEAQYRESTSGLVQTMVLDSNRKGSIPTSISSLVGQEHNTFQFIYATVRVCAKFGSILEKMQLNSMFNLPAVYVFSNSYFSKGNRIGLFAISSLRGLTPSILGKGTKAYAMETSSYAEILGADLMKMEFEAKLSSKANHEQTVF